MKRTSCLVGVVLVIAVAMFLLLSQVDDVPVTAQLGSTPTRFAIHWDRYQCFEEAVASELIKLYVDLEVRCDGQVVLSQVLDLNGPASELGEGLFRGYDWSWGDWIPPVDMTCVEWHRIRWEVPEAAGAVMDGEIFAGQLFGEYWPPPGRETEEDSEHFWRLGPLAGGEWWESCPGAPDCAAPPPTLTPRPTLTPVPEPTCRPTPTCPGVTPWPTEPLHPTVTPWPTQPPL